jgi:hypothetical protein
LKEIFRELENPAINRQPPGPDRHSPGLQGGFISIFYLTGVFCDMKVPEVFQYSKRLPGAMYEASIFTLKTCWNGNSTDSVFYGTIQL